MESALPKPCKAIVLDSPASQWSLREVPLELPKEGEILLKTLACGVCHSDVALRDGEFNFMAKFPVIPGHEVIGTVVALGPGVKNWKVGDRAGGAWHGGHDGLCKWCNRCMFQMCENELVNGVSRNGGWSEYCLLRSEAAVHVPSDVDPADLAPLLCAGITTFNAIRKMHVIQGDTVAIYGIGGLGHLAIQFAHRMGYRTVAISTSEEKRRFALQLGADRFINSTMEDPAETLQKMGGASMIMMTAPSAAAMRHMAKGCAPGGKLVLIAPVPEVSFEFVPLVIKGVSIHGWSSGYAMETEEAIAFAIGKNVKCMVEKFTLDQVEEALDCMLEGDVRFRPVITFE